MAIDSDPRWIAWCPNLLFSSQKEKRLGIFIFLAYLYTFMNLPLFILDASDAAGAGVGMFILAFYCVLLIVGLALTAFWLWMLVNAIKRENYDNPNDKLLWILIILLTHWLGALIYYFMIKKKKDDMNMK